MFEIVYRYDSDQDLTATRPADAEQAHERLLEGNLRFAKLIKNHDDLSAMHQEVIPIDFGLTVMDQDPAAVPKQQPFAAVLSCSDARVPVELIFHQAYNDMFVVRLAGNVMTKEGVGSIGYALTNLEDSVKLVVVLGHTSCGALAAAVDHYLAPAADPDVTAAMEVRSIIDRVLLPVRFAAQTLDHADAQETPEKQKYRERLLQLAVFLNSAMTAMSLQQKISELASVQCPVVYGVHNLRSCMVWAPSMEADLAPWDKPRLASPPSSPSELEALANRLKRVVT